MLYPEPCATNLARLSVTSNDPCPWFGSKIRGSPARIECACPLMSPVDSTSPEFSPRPESTLPGTVIFAPSVKAVPGRNPHPRKAHPAPSNTKAAAIMRTPGTDVPHLRRSTFTLPPMYSGPLWCKCYRPDRFDETTDELTVALVCRIFAPVYPGRASPAAFWSLELAEKLSNYLNI